MAVFHVGTPPFSSISLLLTAHARNITPATVEAVRQLRLRLWLAVKVWVWAVKVKVWVWAVKVWVWTDIGFDF